MILTFVRYPRLRFGLSPHMTMLSNCRTVDGRLRVGFCLGARDPRLECPSVLTRLKARENLCALT